MTTTIYKTTENLLPPLANPDLSGMPADQLEKEIREQSALLALGNDFAGVRSKADLEKIIRVKLRSFFTNCSFVISTLDNLSQTHSSFIIDQHDEGKRSPGFEQVSKQQYPVGDGVFNRVIGSAEPITLQLKELLTHQQVPGYISFWGQTGVRQLTAIRLVAGKEVIGCIWLPCQGIPNRRFLSALSVQIGIALSNVLNNEQQLQRQVEKSALLAFSNQIATVKNKDDLSTAINCSLKHLQLIGEYYIRLINDDQALKMYLTDPGAVYAKHPDYPEHLRSVLKVEGSLAQSVLQSEEPMIFEIKDLLNRQFIPDEAIFWKKSGYKEIIGVRLRTGNQNLGLIWLEAVSFKADLLKAICAQISIAIANILAHEQILRQLEEINQYKLQLETENKYLHQQIQTEFRSTEIIGSGPEMQQVFKLTDQVAFASSTVIILGETGTGKELVARAIHNASPRRNKLMVKVNCAALPANLIESELFGHERGSFTGATDRRIGKFELADQGTLFLDEIGEMPLELQVKLLRALQEKEIERVGGKGTIKVDVRIVAATNRNLKKDVEAGLFRSDLYYRLNVFPIHMPALRERTGDIPALAQHFVNKFSKNSGRKVAPLSDKILQQLALYDWPGNVRELEHLMERSVLLCQGNGIKEVHLPKAIVRPEQEEEITVIKTLEDNERDHIIYTLKRCSGKIFGHNGAAELLGIPASTLNSKISKLGIKKEQMFTT